MLKISLSADKTLDKIQHNFGLSKKDISTIIPCFTVCQGNPTTIITNNLVTLELPITTRSKKVSQKNKAVRKILNSYAASEETKFNPTDFNLETLYKIRKTLVPIGWRYVLHKSNMFTSNIAIGSMLINDVDCKIYVVGRTVRSEYYDIKRTSI